MMIRGPAKYNIFLDNLFIYLFIYTLFYVDIYNKKHKTLDNFYLKITSGLKNTPGYVLCLNKLKNCIKIALKPIGSNP